MTTQSGERKMEETKALDLIDCEVCGHTARLHKGKSPYLCRVDTCKCNYFKFPKEGPKDSIPVEFLESADPSVTPLKKLHISKESIDNLGQSILKVTSDDSLLVEKDDYINKFIKTEFDEMHRGIHEGRMSEMVMNNLQESQAKLNISEKSVEELYQTISENLGLSDAEIDLGIKQLKDANAKLGSALPNGEVRTQSSTGAEKGVKPQRYDLIPVPALDFLAELYGNGAKKYAAHNWRRGYEWSKSYAAAMRHMTRFWEGEDIDPEMQVPHVICAAFHMFALATYLVEHPEFDDRFSTTEKKESFTDHLTSNPELHDWNVQNKVAGILFSLDVQAGLAEYNDVTWAELMERGDTRTDICSVVYASESRVVNSYRDRANTAIQTGIFSTEGEIL